VLVVVELSGGEGVRLLLILRLEEDEEEEGAATGDLLPAFVVGVVDSSDVLSGVVFGVVVLEPGVLPPVVPLSSPCWTGDREELLLLEADIATAGVGVLDVVTFFSGPVPAPLVELLLMLLLASLEEEFEFNE
jgi:hypothetical protein